MTLSNKTVTKYSILIAQDKKRRKIQLIGIEYSNVNIDDW